MSALFVSILCGVSFSEERILFPADLFSIKTDETMTGPTDRTAKEQSFHDTSIWEYSYSETGPALTSAGETSPDRSGIPEGLEVQCITVINPIYSDVITADDIPTVDLTEEEWKEILRDEVGSTGSEEGTEHFSSSQSALKADSTSSSLFHQDIGSAGFALRKGLIARETEIRIYYQSSESQDSKALCSIIYSSAVTHTGVPNEGDYLFYEYGGYNAAITDPSMLSGTDVYSYLFIYSPLYYTTAEQEESVTSAVSSVLSQLDLSGKTDYEKVKSIYDYLTANVSYDYDTLNDDSYTLKYTGYAALVNRKAVCQGYSVAFYRLCLESGIDTRVIGSNTMCHAWNIVNLKGCYYALDSTWDSGRTTYSWFLKGSHTWLSAHTVNGFSSLGDPYNNASFLSNYPIPEEDYTRYGSVSYDANGGEGAPDIQIRVKETDLILSSRIPVYTGYYFLGWSQKADADTPDYVSESTYSSEEDITLYALWGKPDLILPVSLIALEEDVFSGGAFSFAALSDKTDYIGSRAFASCKNLNYIYIPSSDAEIDPNAFTGIQDFVILGSSDSTAEKYARMNGITFQPVF